MVFGAGSSFRLARDGDVLDNVGFVHFSDPDGIEWTAQQITRDRDGKRSAGGRDTDEVVLTSS